MPNEAQGSELLINGDFATGDTTGWTVNEPQFFRVLQRDAGHILRMNPAPNEASLRQMIANPKPGSYVFSHWHGACDPMGNPVPGQIRVLGRLLAVAHDVPDVPVDIIVGPVFAGSWTRSDLWFTVPEGATKTSISLSFQNIDNRTFDFDDPLLEKALRESRNEIVEGPAALGYLSIWRQG